MSETESVDESTAPRCPSCAAETYRRHCKYVCPAHGVVMDCGDTFW